jgi:hypothetical protein
VRAHRQHRDSPCRQREPKRRTALSLISTRWLVFSSAVVKRRRDLAVHTCAACRAPEIVVAKRHTADEWDEIIAKMVDRGAVANGDEQQQILEYLAKFFWPA